MSCMEIIRFNLRSDIMLNKYSLSFKLTKLLRLYLYIETTKNYPRKYENDKILRLNDIQKA